MIERLAADAYGTFWLVSGGCGSAVLAAGFVAPRIKTLAVFPPRQAPASFNLDRVLGQLNERPVQ